MDASTLAARLRAIVGTPPPGPPALHAPAVAGATLEQALGGGWLHQNGVACFVVERRCDPAARHGSETLSAISARLAAASAEAPLVAGGAPARPPFVFFDLETTGLSGGAGTYAFLVGFGRFDGEGAFLTRQFVLARQADERPLLQMLAAELAVAGALVTFNGKSFDAPLIETRYQFHRLEWEGSRLPHLDVLHPARRFWGGDEAATTCSLAVLERQVLGAHRSGDVPGADIPGRYFQFIRSGDARPLAAVLEHNRLDLLSLAGLTARLCDLVRRGPDAAQHAREALALGRTYARCGIAGRALDAYQRAKTMGGSTATRVDALRGLALLSRRARRFEEAAACWRDLLAMPACPRHVAREASDALAVHHEHRRRDLPAARAFALRSLDAQRPAWNQAVQRRLARLERKMERLGAGGSSLELKLES
jgi:uncharacterized protein